MTKFYSLIFTIFFISNFVYAEYQLTVSNPQLVWSNDQGNIDEAVITVKPKGIYTEYGLYLTFSAERFHSTEQLEVVLDFELPPNSIVTDSWLWIGDDIIRGIIMDKWTASSLYEDIVDRQRDPSILFKKSPTQYQLRIYPMTTLEPRKVKLTYLVPTKWTGDKVEANLPMKLLQTSETPLKKIHILAEVSNEWKNPGIIQKPEVEFTEVSDSNETNFLLAEIPLNDTVNPLTLSYSSSLEDNIFLSIYKKGTENYYQLAVLPPSLPKIGKPKKELFLMDYYSSGSSSPGKSEIIANLKNHIKNNFTENDSFNIFLSALEIKKADEKWLSADSANIENVFSNFVTPENISYYSNLVALLNEAVKFVNKDESESQIIIISDSYEYGEINSANEMIKDVMESLVPVRPIYFLDFYTGYNSYWSGNRYFYGNEYLYENLSRLTKGEYFSTRYDGSTETLFSKLRESMEPAYNSIDLHTKLQNGFCYNRFSINYGFSTSMNEAILQVGKYKGDFPFIVEASAVYDTNYYYNQFEIAEDEVIYTDSASELIWTGNMIQNLENSGESNSIINEIIYHSTALRILSKYTAFICLEPNQGGEVCYDCYDDTGLIIGVKDDESEDDSVFTAFPNPFNMETQIVVKLSKSFDLNNLTFKIYNILGEQVKSFSSENKEESRSFKFNWNGKNDYGEIVSSGVYLFTVTSASDRQTLKLILMK